MTGEWSAKFRPGAKVRFRQRGKQQWGVVSAHWVGRDGYKVQVRTADGWAIVQPVENELELLTEMPEDHPAWPG